MANCTNCSVEVDSTVIDPDMPQAAFCSEECIEAFDLPDYVAPVIFPEVDA